MFDRNDAFSMEISSTDDKIVKQLVIDGELLMFTENGIYKVLTADEIDLKNEHS